MSRHFDDAQYEKRQLLLANELSLSLEELESIPLDADSDIETNTGSTGDMAYNYYFYVPDTTPEEILLKKGWVVGDRVELSINLFDDLNDH